MKLMKKCKHCKRNVIIVDTSTEPVESVDIVTAGFCERCKDELEKAFQDAAESFANDLKRRGGK